MEPSSSYLPTELLWTVMWTSTLTGVPTGVELYITAVSLSSLIEMFSEGF